jgi:hypothetical protein
VPDPNQIACIESRHQHRCRANVHSPIAHEPAGRPHAVQGRDRPTYRWHFLRYLLLGHGSELLVKCLEQGDQDRPAGRRRAPGRASVLAVLPKE